MPTREGQCPSCRQGIHGDASVVEHKADTLTAHDAGSICDDLERLRLEDAIRRHEGKQLRLKGNVLVVIGFIVGICTSLLFPLNIVILIPIASAAKRALSESQKLLMPHALLLLERDKRAPVLYLRSFQDDGSYAESPFLESAAQISPLSAVSRRHSYEEQIAETAKCVGPVIAIGRPCEPLPELGAARMYVPESKWRVQVRELMEQSRLVILRAGHSLGLQWELTTAVHVVPPENLILYLEPRGALPDELRKSLPVDTAQSVSKARFIHFESDWTTLSASSLRRVLKHKGIYRVQRKTIVTVSLILVLCVFLVWFVVINLL
ncbi:MAG: hypothetical protein ACYTGL_06910 [Planctomycetota bacterium]